MDNFKQHIRSQRDDMDMDMPADAVWEGIAAEQRAKKGKLVRMIRGYAAAACITALAIWGLLLFSRHKAVDPAGDVVRTNQNCVSSKQSGHLQIVPEDSAGPAKASNVQIVPAEVKAALAAVKKQPLKKTMPPQPDQTKTRSAEIVNELQNNYSRLVNMQISKLNKMPIYTVAPGYFNTYKIQLKQLDEDEAALKKDIRQQGLNGLLLEKLININQQKLNLLKTLQSEISKINNQVKTTGPGIDSIKTSFLNI